MRGFPKDIVGLQRHSGRKQFGQDLLPKCWEDSSTNGKTSSSNEISDRSSALELERRPEETLAMTKEMADLVEEIKRFKLFSADKGVIAEFEE